MKRRKDSGFTLIELMIVIAVIGILAIVLVPKVGTIKNQAKEAGLDTNIRIVQGYVESKIDKWASNGTTTANIAIDIDKAFTGTNKALTNPIKSTTSDAASGNASAISGDPSLFIITGETYASIAATHAEGSIILEVTGGSTPSITIHAHDSAGAEVTEKRVTITP